MKLQTNLIRMFIFFAFLVSTIVVIGQDGQQRERIKDKVKAQRVAYITQELELSETEAQKFGRYTTLISQKLSNSGLHWT